MNAMAERVRSRGRKATYRPSGAPIASPRANTATIAKTNNIKAIFLFLDPGCSLIC